MAAALDGYRFAEGAITSWELDISPQTECEPEPEDVLAVPVAPELIPADECGVASKVKLAETQRIGYAMVTTANKALTTATTLEGYTFAEDAVTSWEPDIAPAKNCELPWSIPSRKSLRESPSSPRSPRSISRSLLLRLAVQPQ